LGLRWIVGWKTKSHRVEVARRVGRTFDRSTTGARF